MEYNKFIHQQCMDRIDSLDRSQFKYRILFVSSISLYFAAISALAGTLKNTIIIDSIDYYIISISFISFAALSIALVLSFIEYIYQEMLEKAIRNASIMESSFSKEGYYFSLVGGRSEFQISWRLSILTGAFYTIPSFVIFFVIGFVCLASSALPEGSMPFWQKAFCLAIDFDTDPDKRVDLCGESFTTTYSPSYTAINWTSKVFIFSFCFFTVFLFYTFWRILYRSRRFLWMSMERHHEIFLFGENQSRLFIEQNILGEFCCIEYIVQRECKSVRELAHWKCVSGAQKILAWYFGYRYGEFSKMAHRFNNSFRISGAVISVLFIILLFSLVHGDSSIWLASIILKALLFPILVG